MKSGSNNVKKSVQRLSNSKIKDALKWIDTLTPQELSKLEYLTRVQLALVLLGAYSKRKRNTSKRKKQVL